MFTQYIDCKIHEAANARRCLTAALVDDMNGQRWQFELREHNFQLTCFDLIRHLVGKHPSETQPQASRTDCGLISRHRQPRFQTHAQRIAGVRGMANCVAALSRKSQ